MAPFQFGLQILSFVVCLSNYPIIQQFCDVENADHVQVWVEEECIWKTVLFNAYFMVGTQQFALVVRLADVKSLYNFKGELSVMDNRRTLLASDEALYPYDDPRSRAPSALRHMSVEMDRAAKLRDD